MFLHHLNLGSLGWVLGGNSLLGSSKFQGTSFGFIEGTEAQFQF
jgi:hypothetical protein